ncbi:hypothetical protein BCR35DRAFT_308836 [Leucosporidium creatinivorum]|uniref:F-box domain-containing protein n=1 Tax=Leucosporidium creatinivorum TaxID=106004 RepID=A0A1Y2DX43_9BASI|nr:hypothetical protein BCR35DRAFT_308836 [Leucosporidium creatinivorum]
MAPLVPDEVKDLITEHVRGFPTKVAGRTLLSLALTSRAFVGCARRALYMDPFRFLRLPACDKAISLLAALELGGLGVFVQKLDVLDSWAADLDAKAVVNDPKRWYELRGQPEGWAWAWAMLKASPRLVSVALPFNTSTQVSKLLKPLRDAKESLKKLTLQSISRYKPSRCLLLELLVSAKLSLNTLHLVNFANDGAPGGRMKVDRIPVGTVEELSIVSSLDLATVSLQLLPAMPTRLRSLELTLHIFNTNNIDNLLQQLRQQLTTLKLALEGHSYWPGGLSSYGRYHNGYAISSDAFKLLPSIKHLQITSSNTLSLARLDNLSRHSPNLQTLSFPESVRICDPPSTTLNAILPEGELKRILETWSDLRSVDLGCVPLASGRSYMLLEATARSRGWALTYRTCSASCPHCGDY